MISRILIDGWEKHWVKSDWKKDENLAGEWNYTSGKWNGDADDKGILLNLYCLCGFPWLCSKHLEWCPDDLIH